MEISSFPIIMSYLDARYIERFKQLLARLDQATNQPEVFNMDYKEINSGLSRILEDVGDKFRDQYYNGGKYQSLAPELQELAYDMPYQLHRVSGFLKNRLAKLPENEITNKLKIIYREAEIFSTAVENLKVKITKGRKPNPNAKPAYQAPKANLDAVRIITDLLTKITHDVREQHIEGIKNWIQRVIENFIKIQADGQLRNNSMHAHYEGNPEAKNIISSLTNTKDYMPNSPRTLKPNYLEIINNLATKQADEMQQAFVQKNTQKLAHIVAGKGNLQEAKVIYASAKAGTIEGRMHISFTDGSHFTVQNTVVIAYSKRGLGFYRFPTTFHDVMLPNGQKMSQPSEEKMNKEFAGTDSPKIESFSDWATKH